MVTSLASGLTWEDRQQIIAGGGMPNRPHIFKPIYQKLVDDVRASLRVLGDASNLGASDPSPRSIQEAAKKYTKRLLRDGTILDRPSQRKGDRLSANDDVLRRLRDIILAGYPDDEGNTRIYRSLQQIADKGPPEFEALRQESGLKTYKALWRQLRRRYPKMAKVAVRLKKKRNAALVQVCLPLRHCVRPFASVLLGTCLGCRLTCIYRAELQQQKLCACMG